MDANLDDGMIPSTPSDGWEANREDSTPARGWEVVAVGRRSSSFEDDLSIFPPSDHEGLLVDHCLTTSSSTSSSSSSTTSPSPSSSSSSFDYHKEYLSVERRPLTPFTVFCYGHLREWRRMWTFGRRMVASGVEIVRSKISWWRRRDGVVGCLAVDERRGVWWAVAMAVMAAWLAFLRRWHRREKLRLLLLVHEKDQMIGRLLHELAQRN